MLQAVLEVSVLALAAWAGSIALGVALLLLGVSLLELVPRLWRYLHFGLGRRN